MPEALEEGMEEKILRKHRENKAKIKAFAEPFA